MNMKKEFIAKVFLHLSRRSDNVIAPKISKHCYQENQPQNVKSIPGKKWSGGLPQGEGVYGASDHQRYDELGGIDNKKRDKANNYPPSIS